MKKSAMLLLLLFAVCTLAGNFPEETGIRLTDLEGKTYDIDALLNSGKHLFIHQTYSG